MKQIHYDIIKRYDIVELESHSIILWREDLSMGDNILKKTTTVIAKVLWVDEADIIITSIKDHSYSV